jgi:hypothetical protein
MPTTLVAVAIESVASALFIAHHPCRCCHCPLCQRRRPSTDTLVTVVFTLAALALFVAITIALAAVTIALFFADIIALAALAITLFVACHLVAIVIASIVAIAIAIVSIAYPPPLSP